MELLEWLLPLTKLTVLPSFVIWFAIAGHSRWTRILCSLYFLVFPCAFVAQLQRGVGATRLCLSAVIVGFVAAIAICGRRTRNHRDSKSLNSATADS